MRRWRSLAGASPEIAALVAIPRAWPRELALAGAAPAAALVLAAWPPLDIDPPRGAWALYALAVTWALSWLLRACLAIADPDAQGARVPMRHYLWRVALAWMISLSPPAAAFAVLRAYDPAGEWAWSSLTLTLILLMALALTALAALTCAHVAATGRFSPLEVWIAIRGHRLATLGMIARIVFGALALFVALLVIPSGLLMALGLPGWVAVLIGGALFHAVWLLALAAVATGARLSFPAQTARR